MAHIMGFEDSGKKSILIGNMLSWFYIIIMFWSVSFTIRNTTDWVVYEEHKFIAHSSGG